MEKMVTVAEGHFRGFEKAELKEPQIKIVNTYTGHMGFLYDEFKILVPERAAIYEDKGDGVIVFWVECPTNISVRTYIYELYPGSPEYPSVLKYRGYKSKFPVRIDP
jgi:hypothetical protein